LLLPPAPLFPFPLLGMQAWASRTAKPISTKEYLEDMFNIV
jgi:hypothetical protein